MRAILRILVIATMLFCSAVPDAWAEPYQRADHRKIIGAISAARGTVVVVNFWATWCPPCRKEIPELVALRKQYPESSLTLLGVSMDQDEGELASFMARHPFNYPIYLGLSDVPRVFGVSAVPRTILYNKQGEQAVSYEGYMPGEMLREHVEKLLKE